MSDPQPGDIGAVLIHGQAGFLIRLGQFLTRVNWKPWRWPALWRRARREHVFVYVGDGQIIEAEPGPGGARLADLAEYNDQPILWLRCPDRYRDAVAAAARGLEHTLYSAADYFALAAHRFHLPIPGLRRYIDDSHRLICSALADRAAELGGWQLFDDGRWRGYVIPLDIARLAEQQAKETT